MNPPRVQDSDLIDFLLATPQVTSATEAQRVQPPGLQRPAHDAFTRLLTRLEPDPQTLWKEVRPLLVRQRGVLVIDDTTLDKPYARQIELVGYHWSGKHHTVVKGINLISLVWTDGDRMYPCDYRLYDAQDGFTKNDHAQAMLAEAHQRGFVPKYVLFDSWYASIPNLKYVRSKQWKFLTRMKSNRKIRLNYQPAKAVSQLPISEEGTVVWLPEFGEVKVFRIVLPNGDKEHWLTNDLEMSALDRVGIADLGWQVEEYHRGIKQHCGVERCQCQQAKAQRNYIGACLRVFVRLEWRRFHTGISWFQTKLGIVRDAIARYLQKPLFNLSQPATA